MGTGPCGPEVTVHTTRGQFTRNTESEAKRERERQMKKTCLRTKGGGEQSTERKWGSREQRREAESPDPRTKSALEREAPGHDILP